MCTVSTDPWAAPSAPSLSVSLLSGAVLLTALDQFQAASAGRRRSFEIILQLQAFRTAMLNQETGVRGYLLTGNEASLDPYLTGVPGLETAIGQLGELIGSNREELHALADAEDAAREWQQNIGIPIVRDLADPTTHDEALAIESSGEGKLRFDTFRDKLNAIQREETEALATQSAAVTRASRNADLALLASVVLILMICGAVGFGINRGIVKPLTRLADAMRRLAQRDLAVDVPGAGYRNEVGEMARAVQVFKNGMIELDRTSLLRVTADTLPALVGYVDAQRRIGFLNGEFGRWFDLHAEDVSEVYGRPLSQVFSADPFPGATKELEAAFGGTESRSEHRLALRGAALRDVEAFYRPHTAPDGSVLGVVTLFTDITERKRMEVRLAQQAFDLLRSNEELEQFAYVASHDLKAPLRGIENLVSWIEEDMDATLSGDTRTNMDLLKNRVRRLENLLDDLLAYSRAGRGDMVVGLVDTKALVGELALLVSPPVGFSISGDDSLPSLRTAAAPLTQVLQNLIGNAIKHHDHAVDGHVWVEARRVVDAFEFKVTDDGPGIPERFRERVFGMFQTLRPRDEVEGSGMGLAIVKKLVERQGGKIWLTEGREGQGLSVHFTWLLNKEDSDGTDRQFAAG